MAYTREQKKLIAIERARRRLEFHLETIDWEFDVLAPKVEELAAAIERGEVVLELEVGEEQS